MWRSGSKFFFFNFKRSFLFLSVFNGFLMVFKWFSSVFKIFGDGKATLRFGLFYRLFGGRLLGHRGPCAWTEKRLGGTCAQHMGKARALSWYICLFGDVDAQHRGGKGPSSFGSFAVLRHRLGMSLECFCKLCSSFSIFDPALGTPQLSSRGSVSRASDFLSSGFFGMHAIRPIPSRPPCRWSWQHLGSPATEPPGNWAKDETIHPTTLFYKCLNLSNRPFANVHRSAAHIALLKDLNTPISDT